MQIKNIQQFRTQWRNAQGYDMSNWDENFIGSTHEQHNGFYKMVNGIVGNIKADLTPKLQNAQDEQAIYEFLQNAADSQSTECAVIYNDTYFMVINNGKAFTEKDLKALLNSFQGTKADKTKEENCGKIGRYGIGFKLAYRLMGKSDGAEELLRDLAGPLLFSWHNREQWQSLLDYQGAGLNCNDAIETDAAPWLLKIILACFPTAPGEVVKDLDYQDQTLFDPMELTQLVDFLNEHQEQLEGFSLEQGSLFFLRFGPKKHEKLQTSLLNIRSGIGYAMNTLKTLEKVALQADVIERYPTTLERYAILPGTEDFERIDPEFPNCPIDISLGFPNSLEQMLALKKAPSLYQFFPMRNERHNMAYFIHSSSFAKITDRTRLDDQGEANVETFQYIHKALKRSLKRLQQDDAVRFCHYYQALLLTDRSTEYDAKLINTYLYDPILSYLKENIPTNKGNFYTKDLVIVKATQLPVEPMSLGIGKEWFHWANPAKDVDTQRAAVNSAKLDLKKWGLKELVLEANLTLLNNLIQQLEEADYQQFVQELKDIDFDPVFAERFAQLKAFKFTNQGGGAQFYALHDLQDQEDLFLMSERLLPIKEAIKGLGFSVLEFEVSDYAMILQQVKLPLDYLAKDSALFDKLTQRAKEAQLTPEQKHALLSFLQTLQGVSTKVVRTVPLLTNQNGETVALQAVIGTDVAVEPWLEGFKIHPEEDHESIAELYINERESWEIYTNIMVPHWGTLAAGAGDDTEALAALYAQVVHDYQQKAGQPKLDNAPYIYVDSDLGFVHPHQVFYHTALSQLEEIDYTALSSAVEKVFQLPLPHALVLPYLSADPFRTPVSTSHKNWKKNLNTILETCQTADLQSEEKKALYALLSKILSGKDLARVALFANQQGDRLPLEQLLPSQAELPTWLQGYRIALEEDDEQWQSALATTSSLYNRIIVPQWRRLIEQNTVQEKISAFYEAVLEYAKLDKSPKLLLTNTYVFVNNTVGFVDSSQVYYHPSLAEETEQYEALRQGLHALTGRYTPHPEILPYLKERIFKTRPVVLAKVLQIEDPVMLDKKEALSLIHFAERAGNDVFTALYITDHPDQARSYEVGKRLKNIPYAVEKGQQDLAEKINALFGETYKRLPNKLYQPNYTNKGLLRGSALFNTISKSKDAPPELLSALIVESGNADVQEQVLSKIDKIILREGQTYDKDSFEHQTLQIFRNKEADYSKIRSKIYIQSVEGEEWLLQDIAYASTVTIAIDRLGKFSLDLASILPVYQEHQILLTSIAEQLVDYEAPTLLQKRCFEGDEKTIEEIFQLLQGETTLDNAHQLAFVVLYARLKDSAKGLQQWSVHTHATEPTPLLQFDAFHMKSCSFIDRSAQLSVGHYEELTTLLKLDSRQPAFYFVEQALVLHPYIERQIFHCTPIRSLQEEEEATSLQAEMVTYLYEVWENLSDEERPERLELATNHDNTLAHFAPQELVSTAAYALDVEQLPTWLEEWLGDEEDDALSMSEQGDLERETTVEAVAIATVPKGKFAFLQAIGVHTAHSPLVMVRAYLNGEVEVPITQKQLNEVRNNHDLHLYHTISWLHQQETLFASDEERTHWLRKLYNTLPEVQPTLPLPLIISVRGTQEEPVLEYMLDVPVENHVYSFDAKQQRQLWEKFDLSIGTVVDCLHQAGDQLTNLDLKGIVLPSTKIQHSLAEDLLETNSQEWGASHYLKWREEVPYRILLYAGPMPYRVHFLGQCVKQYQVGDAVLCDTTVYLNREVANLEEALFAVSKSTGLTESHLVQLLRLKNEEQAQPEEHPTWTPPPSVAGPVLSEYEEAIENPSLEEIEHYQSTSTKATLQLDFDLSVLPAEKLQELLAYAQSSMMIVDKEATNEEE